MDDLSAVDLNFLGDVSGSDPPGVDLGRFGPDQPLFSWAPGFGIAPGDTVSFSFAIGVDGLAEPGEVLLNTIEADWTSLSTSEKALNPSGEIGPDGSATGMRVGALPNAGDALNDYEAQAIASLDVPPLVVSKLDVAPALVPEIGAHKPFQVVIALPEGAAQNVVLTDSLDAGAVSYVLADNADFDVTYDFDGIVSINGQPPGAAAFTAVPADGTSGSAVWSVGDVVTATEDDLATSAAHATN